MRSKYAISPAEIGRGAKSVITRNQRHLLRAAKMAASLATDCHLFVLTRKFVQNLLVSLFSFLSLSCRTTTIIRSGRQAPTCRSLFYSSLPEPFYFLTQTGLGLADEDRPRHGLVFLLVIVPGHERNLTFTTYARKFQESRPTASAAPASARGSLKDDPESSDEIVP